MGLFKNLDLPVSSTIDWEMTPEYTFGTFESWGGKERIRSMNERIYYFFIDGWGEAPKLCLMERGIKHARIVARISAPENLLKECIKSQGRVALYDKSFAIDKTLKEWLITNVVDTNDSSRVIPLNQDKEKILPPTELPGKSSPLPEIQKVLLAEAWEKLSMKDIAELIRKHNFYDFEKNPEGTFTNYLVDNNDSLTVSDKATGLMWQREGLDIMSYKMLQRKTQKINEERFAGYSDWRIPSLAEALSLMQVTKNKQGQHIHSCFSPRQPFIFTTATRRPGGYWFVDYNHGRTFWSSGTIPGGFGRLCRTEP